MEAAWSRRGAKQPVQARFPLTHDTVAVRGGAPSIERVRLVRRAGEMM